MATSNLIGSFDGIVEGHAVGWVRDKTRPNIRPNVEIMCGDILIGLGPADLARADLLNKGIGDGNHAFKIALSPEVNTCESAEIKARVLGARTFLPGKAPRSVMVDATTRYRLPRRIATTLYRSELAHMLSPSRVLKLDSYVRAFEMACLLQETGQHEDAEKAFLSLDTTMGTTTTVAMKRAELALHRQDTAFALDSVGYRLPSPQQRPWHQITLALIAGVSRRYDSALDHLLQATLTASEEVDAGIRKAAGQIVECSQIEDVGSRPLILISYFCDGKAAAENSVRTRMGGALASLSRQQVRKLQEFEYQAITSALYIKRRRLELE